MIILNYIIAFIVASIASCTVSIIYHTPRNQILFAGLVGGTGWLVYIILRDSGLAVTYSSFFATIVLTFFARVLSHIRKTPVSVFLITGIFPLVPGLGIYNTGYSLFMSADTIGTLGLGISTIEIAIAIALGMGLTLSLPSFLFKWSVRKK